MCIATQFCLLDGFLLVETWTIFSFVLVTIIQPTQLSRLTSYAVKVVRKV